MSDNNKWWIWPEAGATETDKREADSFQDKRRDVVRKEIINLVREATQNTLDESDLDQHPANISFKYVPSDEVLIHNSSIYFSGLKDYIKTATANDDNPLTLSEDEIKHPDFLLIQDSNTGGIKGSWASKKRQDNAFWNFLMNWGVSNKVDGRPQRGSKGEGRQTFLFASKIKSIFVHTKQSENKEAIAGIAFLNAIEDSTGVYRGSSAYFAKEYIKPVLSLHSGNDDLNSDSQRDIIRRFERCFEYNFDNVESGTAIVIPLPKENIISQFHEATTAGLIEHFAPSIISGTLEPNVGDEVITHNNIIDLTTKYKKFFSGTNKGFAQNSDKFIQFLFDGLHDENQFTIDVKTPKVHNSIFNDDQIESIYQKLKDRGLLKLRFNVQFTQLTKNSKITHQSYFDVLLGKPSSASAGVEMYYRSGMSIPELGKSKKAAGLFNAAVLADEKSISDLLNAAEDTGHSNWYEGSSLLEHKGYQEDAKDIVQFIKSILGIIKRECFDNRIEEDFEAFDDLFLFEDDLGISDPSTSKDLDQSEDEDVKIVDPGPDDEFDRTPEPFSIAGISNGFKLSHDHDFIKPSKIYVSVKYKQDPTVKRSKGFEDFKDINCKALNCNVTEENSSKGLLAFVVDQIDDGFSLEVKGFNSNLEIECTARSEK